MQLSKAEEQVMQFLWKRKKAFMKDLLEDFKEPKPATTTVATLLKRMNDKGFIAYTLFGKSREYYPLVKKRKYRLSFKETHFLFCSKHSPEAAAKTNDLLLKLPDKWIK